MPRKYSFRRIVSLVFVMTISNYAVTPAAAQEEPSIAVSHFAESLIRGLRDDQNLVFSPASLGASIGMAYTGARGETAAQMAEVLHVEVTPNKIQDLLGNLTSYTPDGGLPTFGARCRDNNGYGLLVTEVLPKTVAERAGLKRKDLLLQVNDVPVRTEADWSRQMDQKTETLSFRWYSYESGTVMDSSVRSTREFLTTTNAVWADKKFELLPEHVKTIEDGFSGAVASVDFLENNALAVKTINNWIANQTAGKITDLLSTQSVSDDTRLVLTNTVHFNARWQTPFAQSQQDIAWTRSGESRRVAGMTLTSRLRFAENDHFQILELPYAQNSLAMVVVLPRPEQNWSEFRKRFSLSKITELRKHLEPLRVRVELPKFSFPSQISLRSELMEQMPLAFSNDADFSGIGREGGLHLHDVIHQAFITVDEQGTEASAASAVIAGIKQAAEATFLANRPFLFFIIDRQTNVMWFAGQLVNA